MAYLHCHNCHWSQDDFWDKDYNPITFMERHYTKDLLYENMNKIIELQTSVPFTKEVFMCKITYRELIATKMERLAQRIRDMVYRTPLEFKEKNPERKCPMCGKEELDID